MDALFIRHDGSEEIRRAISDTVEMFSLDPDEEVGPVFHRTSETVVREGEHFVVFRESSDL